MRAEELGLVDQLLRRAVVADPRREAGTRSGGARARPSASAPGRRSGSARPRSRTRSGRARARRGRTARSGARRRRSAATASSVGTSRLTTTGARPSESSSTSTIFGSRDERLGEHDHLLLAAREQARRRRSSASRARGRARARRRSRSSRPRGSSEYVATRRLSSTVSSGRSRRPSGTTATPAARTCSGRRPVRSRSPSRTLPPVVRSTPPTASTSVDLPAPFAPSRVVTWPGRDLQRDLVHDRPPAAGDGELLEAEAGLGGDGALGAHSSSSVPR